MESSTAQSPFAFHGEIQESYPAGLGQIQARSAWSPGTKQSPGGSFYDLSGLYLQVLEDLWAVDSGLNASGVNMVSVDLSQAPGGLLESERQAIAWRFGELHGAEPLTASYEEEDLWAVDSGLNASGVNMVSVDLSQAPGGLLESERQAIAWRFGELHGAEPLTASYEELVDQGYITGEPLEGGGGEFMEWKDGVLFSITANEDHEGEAYSLPALFFHADKWRSSLGAYEFYDCSCLWPELGTWESYQVESQMIS